MTRVEGVVRWPEDVAARYRASGVWKGVSITDALEPVIAANRDRCAVVDGDRRLTFGELRALYRRLASALLEREICDGARVVFQLPNRLEFVVAYLACLKVGAVPVMCHPHHRETEISTIGRIAEASAWLFAATHRGFDFGAMAAKIAPTIPSLRLLVSIGEAAGTETFAELIANAREDDDEVDRHPPAPDAPAVFQLSGGTTGIPKLIPRTHDDYLYNSLAFAKAASFDRDTVLLVGIPAGHNFALACPGIQGALLAGGRVVLAASPSAEIVLPLIERERVTWIPAVPATLLQWTQHPRRSEFDVSSLRGICVGGQRLNPEPARAAALAFGPVIRQSYGMAEGLACCTPMHGPEAVSLETQGRPISELDELRIVDDEGRDVKPGEVGELLCRGPYTIRGYYRAAEYNAIAFTEDGFYRTGDMVRAGPERDLVVEGRKKDLINRGGEKISAEEIENLVLAHGAVALAAVVGIPDVMLGERACACVVLHEGSTLTLDELVTFLREHGIAAFKLPERLELFDALPLTGVGKVSKKDLRLALAARLAGHA